MATTQRRQPTAPRQPASEPPSAGRVRAAHRLSGRLPSNRALIGAVLIAASGAGVLVAHRAATTPRLDRYVVVTGDVAAQQPLRAADLGTVALQLAPDISAVPAAEADSLIGRRPRLALEELDLVRPSDLFEPGRFASAESVEVAIELDMAGALGGSLEPGMSVDVLSTDPDSDGTRTLARRVLVVATDGGDRDAIGSSGSVAVRLGLDSAETAEAVVDAAVREHVTLSMPSPVTDPSSVRGS